MPEVGWNMKAGDVIKRTALHDRFGDSGRGGISPSRRTPNVVWPATFEELFL
jgi:hypothetical protein